MKKPKGNFVESGHVEGTATLKPLSPPKEEKVVTRGSFNQPGYSTKVNDKLHSIDGFPALITQKGTQIWYKHGLVHRENDLPAMIRLDGEKSWYKNDKLHRLNDPAVMYPNGNVEYWINGEQINK